jgi:hypothetical protein
VRLVLWLNQNDLNEAGDLSLRVFGDEETEDGDA